MKRLFTLAVLLSAVTLKAASPFQITTTSLPDAVIGQPYSLTLQTANAYMGLPLIGFNIVSGNAPPGFAIGVMANSTSGIFCFGVSGPSGPICGGNVQGPAASYTFTVEAEDYVEETAFQTYTLNVVSALQISTPSLPFATVNQPYSLQFTVTGGVGDSWTTINGTAPPQGFTLSGTGLLTGMTSTPGATTFTVQVFDETQNATATRQFTLYVTLGPLQLLTQSPLPAAAQNTAYQTQMTAALGLPPYQWSLLQGTQGLTIDSGTGVISGIPPTVGNFQLTIALADATGTFVQQTFTLQVNPQLRITTTAFPNARVGVAYSQGLTATGGQVPYTWTLITGTLPAGLRLDGVNGIILGTPTAATAPTGTSFVLQVIDSAQRSASATLTMTVTGVTITNTSLSGIVGTSFSAALTATGGVAPLVWSVSSGALPALLQLNPSTGAISGTPSAAGTTNVTFMVTDKNGATGTFNATISIALPPPPSVTVGVGTSSQPPVSVTLGGTFPVPVTGALTLTFLSSVGGGDDDNMKVFSNGLRTLGYSVPAGTTQAIFNPVNPAVLPGTVAGTITLTASLLAPDGSNITPNPPPTQTIIINPSAPTISSVTLQQITGGFNVIVEGASSTREISSGLFHFAVSSGNSLSQSDITIALTSAYATWFSGTAANQFGGLFKLTVPFNVAGSATSVTTVTVTLTNGQGNSAAVKSQ